MADMRYQFVYLPSDPARLHIPKNLLDLTLEPWQKLPACHGKNRSLRVGELARTKPYTLKQVPGRICPDCLDECDANGLELKNYDRGIVYEEPIDEPPQATISGAMIQCPECGVEIDLFASRRKR